MRKLRSRKQKKKAPPKRVKARTSSELESDNEEAEISNIQEKRVTAPFTPCEGHRGYVTVPSDQYTPKDIFKPVVFGTETKRKRKAKSITDM